MPKHINYFSWTLILFLVSVKSVKGQSNNFRDIILKALKTGEKNISLPKGIYRLELPDWRPFTFKDLENVVIDGNGSHIICTKNTQAIEIMNCKNLRLQNFTIDYDPLPFTQGEVIRQDAEQKMWMDIKIMDGYPQIGIEKNLPDRLQIFDPQTRTLKKNFYTYWKNDFSRIEKITPQIFRIYKSRYNPQSIESVGDYVVFSLTEPPRSRPHAIYIHHSEGVVLNRISIYASNCFGIFEDQCSANIYQHCVINRKAADSTTAFARLRSTNADAFHSKAAEKGPTVENCTFLHNGDDGIAINSSFYMIGSSKNNSIRLVTYDEPLKIKIGHLLRIVDYKGRVKADVRVTEIRQTKMESAVLGKLKLLFDDIDFRHIKRTYALTLSDNIKAYPGDVVSSLDMSGSGFLIRNNRIGHSRARGILVKASHGIISDNLIEGCELSGIVLAPELSWMEAGYARDVRITDNVIKDCMYANSSYGIEQAAALSVVAINAEGEFAPAGGFNHIVVQNNQILNCPAPAIMLTSLKGGIVENNRISISKTIVRTHGKKFGVDNERAIWYRNTKKLILTHNQIDNPTHP